MMSIVFNFSQSYIHQKIEAIALKAGYLLSNKICCAGSTCYDIYTDDKKTGDSLFSKLDFLERMSLSNLGFLKEVRSMRSVMKRAPKGGHAMPGYRVRRREGENLINITYESFLKIYQDNIKNYGLQELKEIGNDDNFCHYSLNQNPEDPTGSKITASDLLQRLLFADDENKEQEPEIFLLDAKFFSDDYIEKPDLYEVAEDEAVNRDTTYLQHCFTLQGINDLSADELRTIHHDIKQAGSAFQQDMNQWIDMCYFDDDTTERLAFFKDRLVPACAGLQQKIDTNATLQNQISLQENVLQTEVWLGEIPVLELWKYYKEADIIKDNTWRKLQRLQQDDSFRDQRWPVMILRIPEEQLEQLLIEEEVSGETVEELKTAFAEKAVTEPVKELKIAFAKEVDTEPVEEIKATRKYISID